MAYENPAAENEYIPAFEITPALAVTLIVRPPIGLREIASPTFHCFS